MAPRRTASANHPTVHVMFPPEMFPLSADQIQLAEKHKGTLKRYRVGITETSDGCSFKLPLHAEIDFHRVLQAACVNIPPVMKLNEDILYW